MSVRKAEEERKAEEAATSSTPGAGSLFTSAPKKSDSKILWKQWRKDGELHTELSTT